MRRNAGKNYINTIGKPVGPKTLGNPYQCKKNCRKSLHGKEQKIFNCFWDLSNYDVQNAYLFGLIKCDKPKRRYIKKTKKNISSQRVTAKYFIKIDGEDIQVCKNDWRFVVSCTNILKKISLLVKNLLSSQITVAAKIKIG